MNSCRTPVEGALQQLPGQGWEPVIMDQDHHLIISIREYKSDLLNNPLVKSLWHVPQELLLFDRFHVGALHLQEQQQLTSFLLFRRPFAFYLSDPGNRVKHLES